MHELKKFIRQVIKYFSSLLFTVYSFTIGILTQRGRYLHSIICHYYGFDFLKPTLPLISWEEVMGNETIELREIKVRPGNMPVDELALICGIVRKEKPKAIFEIGTFNGRTSLNMALNAPEKCKIYTLDLPEEELTETHYKISKRYQKLVRKEKCGELILNLSEKEFPPKKKITQLLGDSGKFDFSPYFNAIDLIFIDGSHDYDYVLHDSEIALQLLRNGKGVILWHDYRFGMEVIHAIDVFRKRYPHLEIYQIHNTSFAYMKRKD